MAYENDSYVWTARPHSVRVRMSVTEREMVDVVCAVRRVDLSECVRRVFRAMYDRDIREGRVTAEVRARAAGGGK